MLSLGKDCGDFEINHRKTLPYIKPNITMFKETTTNLIHIWETMWDERYEELMNSKNEHNALKNVDLHFNNVRMRCFYRDENTNKEEEFCMTHYFNHNFENGEYHYHDYILTEDIEPTEDIDYDYEIIIGSEHHGILVNTESNTQYNLNFEEFDRIRDFLQSAMDRVHQARKLMQVRECNIRVNTQKYRMMKFIELFQLWSTLYTYLIGYNEKNYKVYQVFMKKHKEFNDGMDQIRTEYIDYIDQEYDELHLTLKALMSSVKDKIQNWYACTTICIKRMEEQGMPSDVSLLIKNFI